jgi:hypothetical protein
MSMVFAWCLIENVFRHRLTGYVGLNTTTHNAAHLTSSLESFGTRRKEKGEIELHQKSAR